RSLPVFPTRRSSDLVLYRGIRQHFTTENLNVPGERIEMRLLSGPFRHLQGVWTFQPLGQAACKVRLRLEYELASGLLERVAGPVDRKSTRLNSSHVK